MDVSSVQFSHSVISDSLQPHGLQYTRLPYPLLSPLSLLKDPTISPLSSLSPPTFNLSQHQSLFQLVSSSHQVTKVSEFQLQHQSFQWMFRIDFLEDWLVWSPCSPRDSQESSPTPQFKNINSLALSILYGPILTSWQTDGETMEIVRDFIWGAPKTTTDGDCSHEIKRHLLLRRKAVTNLDIILKSRDIISPRKFRLVKAMVFPVVMYGCENWTIKKAKELMVFNCGVR